MGGGHAAPTGALKFWFVCFSSFIFICVFKVPASVVCQSQASCVWPGHLASSAYHRTALSCICFPFVCIAGGGVCPLGLACAHPCVYPPLSPRLFFPAKAMVCVCRAVSRVYPLHSYACTSVPRLAAVPTCPQIHTHTNSRNRLFPPYNRLIKVQFPLLTPSQPPDLPVSTKRGRSLSVGCTIPPSWCLPSVQSLQWSLHFRG